MRPLVLSRTEIGLLAFCAALLAAALFGPAVAQPANYHAFADQRTMAGLPFAMDVLSNLPFAIAGLLGAWALWRLPASALTPVQRFMAALFFGGLLVTATGSTWYHLQPSDAGLAIDRGAMVLPFAGLLGLAAASRISERAGLAVGLSVLVLGPLSVHIWAHSGNLLPWALVQGGGMVLLLGLAQVAPRPQALPVRWAAVLAIYALAKGLELHDHEVFQLTGQVLSGHTLKHIVAALAAWPVVSAIEARFESRQNAPTTTRRSLA